MPTPRDRLRAVGAPPGSISGRHTPLWKGPEQDGITQSLLARFLNCRERFRVLVVEGLRPPPSFNPRMEYGSMWHACEEAYASRPQRHWTTALSSYAALLAKKYPFQRDDVAKWADYCHVQFPLYAEYWTQHPDVLARTPLVAEQVFDVPYTLPSGRVVKLRGKWDSVDLVTEASKGGKNSGIWLQENKTKSDIDGPRITRQLTFDLQTMFYLVALRESASSELALKGWTNATYGRGVHDLGAIRNTPVRGVRYNVVKRPAQYQGKRETRQEFLGRLHKTIAADPDRFFARWNVEVTADDVTRFRQKFLDPILEQLCLWYDVVVLGHPPWVLEAWAMSWQHPFGVRNILDEGGATDLDEYLLTGSTIGLERADGLFGELQ